MSAAAEIAVLAARLADAALDKLTQVLVHCVAGGASVNFLSARACSRSTIRTLFQDEVRPYAAATWPASQPSIACLRVMPQ